VSRRLALQKGFERLLVYDVTAPIACERIEGALHEGRLELFRNGESLKHHIGYIKTNLRVVVEQRADGRWCCAIVETHAMWAPIIEVDDSQLTQVVTVALPPLPVWEVDAEGIEALRGMQPTERWTNVVDNELQRLWNDKSPLLRKKALPELYGYLTMCVEQRTGVPPPNPKRFRRRIRNFLAGVQKL
jgi:hypothetical protein